MVNSNPLLQRLQALNADGRKYMAEHPRSWVGMLTEDLNHWAGYGITTPDQLDEYLDGCVALEREKGNLA